MKIGRNEPCPCGSGKKYKNCCLAKTAAPPLEGYYRRLCEAHDQLMKRLVAFGKNMYDEWVFSAAVEEFLLWPDPDDEASAESFDRAGLLFWFWFIYNWVYDPDEETDDAPENHTIAELYAREHAGRLNPFEELLLGSINRKPYTFLEVIEVDRGKGMRLQDVLTGARIEVQERSGSQNVQPGDLLFGRAVVVDGVGMLMGLSEFLIPPSRKTDVIRLRKQLQRHQTPVSDDTLREWEEAVREMYFHIDQALHTRPRMVNTDGHEIELHRLIYEVTSADEAFEKLCGLCVTMTPEELRTDAQRDHSGRIMKVEFPWNRKGHKGDKVFSDTILGQIAIDGTRLIAEVNSARRAVKLRREIDTRLGDNGRFIIDEIQELESLPDNEEAASGADTIMEEHEELMSYPEVQEKVTKALTEFWENWVDTDIPALEGKTPREAVRTADGRESVEALLKDAERLQGRDPFTAQATSKGIQRAREILGLS